MGIFIRPTVDKKIKISGTDIELNEVYGRIDFVGRQDGKNLEIATTTYVSKQTYTEGKPIFTDIPQGNFYTQLQETEEQSVQTALLYAKLGFEQLGYEAVVDNLL
jgi:hypothetical protein